MAKWLIMLGFMDLKWPRVARRSNVCLVHHVPSAYHHESFRSYHTKVMSMQKVRGQGQRSKVKVTEVTTQLNCFRTVTPVWIHIWWWNDAYGLTLLREVPYSFSKSSVKFQGHTALKIIEFDSNWAFPDCNSSLNSPMATKWCKKL